MYIYYIYYIYYILYIYYMYICKITRSRDSNILESTWGYKITKTKIDKQIGQINEMAIMMYKIIGPCVR